MDNKFRRIIAKKINTLEEDKHEILSKLDEKFQGNEYYTILYNELNAIIIKLNLLYEIEEEIQA